MAVSRGTHSAAAWPPHGRRGGKQLKKVIQLPSFAWKMKLSVEASQALCAYMCNMCLLCFPGSCGGAHHTA